MGNWLLALFVSIQIVLLVVAWRKLSTEENAWHTRTNAWASILTVVGIFGTFLGICIGLWHFEVTNIEESIGPLLEGLKLAFLTSVVGIGSSLILKFGSLFQKIGPDAQENPITVLNQIRDSLTGGQSTTHTELRKLKAVVRANHDQLAKLGKEEGDKTRETLKALEDVQKAMLTQLGQLVGEFRAFSENVAESVAELATKELIGALETVIKNFNAKITEQFGDNFKQLNEAVGQTLEWQKQYRQQMSELISQMSELISGLGDAAEIFERARDSLEDIAKSSRLISERSESIVACAEKLDPVLHTLNDQLEAFSELRERAQEAFPVIEDRLTELTIGFSDAVTKTITASHASMAAQRAALTAQSEQIQTTLDGATQEFTELTNNFSVSVQTALDRAQTNTAEQKAALQQLQNIIKATLEGFSKVVDDTVTQSQLSMRQQREELATLTRQLQENFRLLESTLEAELTSCLKVLAGQLAGISDKFVKDYTPLTEELHRIVNVARNVPPVNNRRL